MQLTIEGVRKEYGDTTAIRALDLTIENGEFLAIVGPSGCGKTTLLRLLGGFERPTVGRILADGEVIGDANDTRPIEMRNWGMVFQSFALWPLMTVREHVEFPLRTRGVSSEKIRTRAAEVLRTLGIESLAERYPAALSGGQKQRVALARAIVAEPTVLLMDEPLSALDAELKLSMREEIKRIHRLTGATVIYVTHDQEEAMAMADRLLVMKDGAAEQLDTPEAVYHRPATRFAATFVGKYTLVDGRWEGDVFIPAAAPQLRWRGRVAPAFHADGVYPVRPDQWEWAADGIAGVVRHRQYLGREYSYRVAVGDAVWTVRAAKGPVEGDQVYLHYRGD